MHDGNKMTEVGLIPEDWNAYNLGDLIIGKPMYGANVAAVDFDIELPRYVRITDIKDDGRLHQTEIKSYPVSEELDYRLNVDDICFARSGATVGKTYLYDPCDGECIFAGYLIKFVPDRNKLIPKYLFHFTHSQHYYNWVKGNLRQGAQPNINAQEYSSLVLPLPPLSEQQKIADILTTVDDHISETESLIEKTKVLKQGLMQQLLTKGIGHTEFKDTEIGRIPVEWEVKKVGDVGSIRKGKGISRDSVTDFGLPCIRYGEIYTDYDIKVSCTKSYISEEIAHNSEIIHFGDLLFTGSGETAEDIGKSVTYLINEAGYAGGDLIILSPDFKIVEPLFLSYQWEIKSIRTQRRKAGQGASIIHLYSDALKKILISLPPLPEQHQIAAILTSVDNQIDTYQAKLASLTRLKTGLMQQLLTGKIRVKV